MEQLSFAKSDMIQWLQKEILPLQGFKKPGQFQNHITNLGPIDAAFPGNTFPLGAVHEFITTSRENAAATNSFITGVLSQVFSPASVFLWIGKRSIFPPALKHFGIEPDRVIFIDLLKPKDVLWTIEEALKCKSVTAVIGELKELSFTESRRLQLAVEQSHVTGFIHRHNPRSEHTVACVTRWKIKPAPCVTEDGMPGVGFPRWNVQLLKVRNGKPGTWELEWSGLGFRYVDQDMSFISEVPQRKTG